MKISKKKTWYFMFFEIVLIETLLSLIRDLQQSIAREPSAPSIPTPAYQSSPAPPTPAPRTLTVSKHTHSKWTFYISDSLLAVKDKTDFKFQKSGVTTFSRWPSFWCFAIWRIQHHAWILAKKSNQVFRTNLQPIANTVIKQVVKLCH